jgi:hypothetical protein
MKRRKFTAKQTHTIRDMLRWLDNLQIFGITVISDWNDRQTSVKAINEYLQASYNRGHYGIDDGEDARLLNIIHSYYKRYKHNPTSYATLNNILHLTK